ncbi:universal stress protein [Microcoleus sp. FACHB-1515]|uniref:universal stress protein n=1 Tax=Cyanophyceae TaxID=3028117 RepID=UPI0016883871|nr:universal stress protein [Microcoleus sp. FACHB-1515]MBD2088887.1 universal stress protein [Microcoleus sp. FACHB-1515]
MFERILICTEFTDGLNRLTNFVGDLAIAGVKQIVFLHAVPLIESRTVPKVDQEKIAQAKAQFAKALQQVPEDVEVKVEVESGKAVDAILKTAKAHQTELIILGTQSRAFITEKLFGSTLVELSRRITIPMLVLRPQLIATFRSEELRLRCQHLFQDLLLPYNGSQSARYLLDRVKHLLQTNSDSAVERCFLCWVVRDGNRRDVSIEPLLDQAKAELLPVQSQLQQLNVQVETEVRQGDPIAAILTIADTRDTSAIVLTSDASSQRFEWFVTSFAGELLRRSLHPILFFPPAGNVKS